MFQVNRNSTERAFTSGATLAAFRYSLRVLNMYSARDYTCYRCVSFHAYARIYY